MSRIYIHTPIGIGDLIPSVASPSFDPEKIDKTSELYVDETLLNKPSTGLWGSPFTDPPKSILRNGKMHTIEENTWETFVMADHWGNETYDDLYCFHSQKELDALLTRCNQVGVDLPHSDADIAKSIREHSFYYAVDQSTLLHVYDTRDITQFTDANGKIDFDAIRQAGYDGVELHSASRLGDTKMFQYWMVDSVVVWNPDCVIQVDREIAAISRFANGHNSEIDRIDPCMDPSHLIDWMSQNKDKVQQAIADGIISQTDIDIVEQSQEIDLDVLLDDQDVDLDDLDIGIPSELETIKYSANELAQYCCDNDLHPISLCRSTFSDINGNAIDPQDLQPGDHIFVSDGIISDGKKLFGSSPFTHEEELVVATAAMVNIDGQDEFVITTESDYMLTSLNLFDLNIAYQDAIENMVLVQGSGEDPSGYDDQDGYDAPIFE